MNRIFSFKSLHLYKWHFHLSYHQSVSCYLTGMWGRWWTWWGEDGDKKWLLTRIKIQSLHFQPYKSHFTCLPLDYRILRGQIAGGRHKRAAWTLTQEGRCRNSSWGFPLGSTVTHQLQNRAVPWTWLKHWKKDQSKETRITFILLIYKGNFICTLSIGSQTKQMHHSLRQPKVNDLCCQISV